MKKLVFKKIITDLQESTLKMAVLRLFIHHFKMCKNLSKIF